MCHPVRLTSVEVHFEETVSGDGLEVVATASARDRTGVEMEALTAVTVAALTVYDMCKAVDREIAISDGLSGEKDGREERNLHPSGSLRDFFGPSSFYLFDFVFDRGGSWIK